MSAPATTMQVKIHSSVSLAAESSRLEFAARLTRSLYSSVALIETFWFFCLTSRSPGSPSPLFWKAERSVLVTCLPHMALASSSNKSMQRFAPHPLFMQCHMEGQMHGLMHGICTQTGRGSDMTSGCQTDFTILNPLTSAVTYIFPFSDQDVFSFYGSIVARDLKCFPIQADNSLQTADCEREKKRHIFQLLFQRG